MIKKTTDKIIKHLTALALLSLIAPTCLADDYGPDKNLYAASCITDSDCWVAGSKRESVYHYDGTQWSEGNVNSNIPDKTFYGIHCFNTDFCFAVGDEFIAKWDGSEWDRATGDGADLSDKLYAIDCTSSNNCWAVGEKETFVHYDGSEWTESTAVNSNVINDKYYAVTCLKANDCWAAGDRDYNGEPVMAHWDGGEWSYYDTDPLRKRDINGLASIPITNAPHSAVYEITDTPS